ncbi:hypothetical protein ACMAY6_02110 [Luminiphilus sp. nBUS_16]|uniref:hypothetical protein n=1 Tax=Luminiphilus sp. nBUS_16 TaxID=3395315 RepID=UPI003EBEEC6A
MLRVVMPLFLIIVLVNCAPMSGTGVSTKNGSEAESAASTQCRDPRPMVCTMEYRPVCATLVSGGAATYPSGCNACADVVVNSWTDGPCEEN